MNFKFRSFAVAFLAVSAMVSAAFAGPRVLKLAHTVNEQDAFHVGALKIKDIVDKESNGKLSVTIFPNGKLGDERVLLENIRKGIIDMAIITDGPVINFMPKFGVFGLPFLFRDEAHAYKVLDGEIGRKMLADMEKAGWKGLAYGERGFRDLTNSVRPVATPADMKGLKIRLMQNPLYVETFRRLGANATPMAWQETLTALQQHTIDGQENPLNVLVSYKLYESQKHLTLTHHTYSPNIIIMSLRCWKSLSADQKALIEKACQQGALANREFDAQNAARHLQILKDNGMIITKHDPAAFSAAVSSIYAEKAAEYGADLIKAIQETK